MSIKSSLAILPMIALLGALVSSCTPSLQGQLLTEESVTFDPSQSKVNVTKIDSPPNAKPFSLVLDVASDGRFTTTEKLAPGTYLVEALVPGFAPASQRLVMEKDTTLTVNLKRTGSTVVSPVGMGDQYNTGSGDANLMPPQM